jgi:hypothetical protein
MKVHSLKTLIMMAMLCVAGSTLVAGEAVADDAKLVPATVCQPLVEPTEDTVEDPGDVLERITNIRYDRNGRVLNQSLTRRLGVVCPILRDNTQRRLRWIRVIVVDQFPDPVVPSADKHEVLKCEARAAAGVATVPSDIDPVDTLSGEFDSPGLAPGTGSVAWYFRLDNVNSGDASAPLSEFGISQLYAHVPDPSTTRQ